MSELPSLDRRTLPWVAAGLVAGAAGMLTSYAAAMVLTIREAPVVAIAELVVRETPGPIVAFALKFFGHYNKSLLLGVIAVLSTVLFALVGRWARERWWLPVAVYTLLAMSWAIEDEFCAKANRATLFGGFQRARHWHRARDRWADLARTASEVHVFAIFDDDEPLTPGVSLVPVPDDSPMRREWTVVCDAPALPAALTAWELPGQGAVPDRSRSIWARRSCSASGAAAGSPEPPTDAQVP